MAQKGLKTITFDVVANTEQVKKEISSISNDIKELKGKDNIIKLRAVVDSKDFAKVDDLLKNENFKVDLDLTGLDDFVNIGTMLSQYENLSKAFRNNIEEAAKVRLSDKIDDLKKSVSGDYLSDISRFYENMDPSGVVDTSAKELGKIHKLIHTLRDDQIISSSDLIDVDGAKHSIDEFERILEKRKNAIKETDVLGDFDEFFRKGFASANSYLKKSNLSQIDAQIEKYKEIQRNIKRLSEGTLEDIFNGNIPNLDTIRREVLANKSAQKLENIEVKANITFSADSVTELKNQIESVLADTKISFDAMESIKQVQGMLEAAFMVADLSAPFEKMEMQIDSVRNKLLESFELDNLKKDVYDLEKEKQGSIDLKTALSDAERLDNKLTEIVNKFQEKNLVDFNSKMLNNNLDIIESSIESLTKDTHSVYVQVLEHNKSELNRVKKELNDLPNNKKINIDIGVKGSLKKLENLSEKLNSPSFKKGLKSIEQVGNSFNKAFNNIDTASKAPLDSLREMNSAALELKKTLNTVGVKKFSEVESIQKILDKQKKQAEASAKREAKELVKIEKNQIKEKQAQVKKNDIELRKKESDIKKREMKLAKEEAKINQKIDANKASEEHKKEQAKLNNEEISSVDEKQIKDSIKAAYKSIDAYKNNRDKIQLFGNTEKDVDSLISKINKLQVELNNVDKYSRTKALRTVDELNKERLKLDEISNPKNIKNDSKKGYLQSDVLKFDNDVFANQDYAKIKEQLTSYFKSQGKVVDSIYRKDGVSDWTANIINGDRLETIAVHLEDISNLYNKATDAQTKFASSMRLLNKGDHKYLSEEEKQRLKEKYESLRLNKIEQDEINKIIRNSSTAIKNYEERGGDLELFGKSTNDVEKLISAIQKLQLELLKLDSMDKDEAIGKGQELKGYQEELKRIVDVKNIIHKNNGNLEGYTFVSDEEITKTKDYTAIQKELVKTFEENGKVVKSIRRNGNGAKDWDVYFDHGDTVEKTKVHLEDVTDLVGKVEDASGKYSSSIRVMSKADEQYVSTGQKWISGLKAKMANLTQYITGIEIVQRAWMEIKEGFSFVKDLDSLMTTIYQTSDITRSGLDELSQSAINQARDLGVATEQVSGAIEVYAAYGETVDSLLNKSAPTTMLAKAAGADVSEASSWIMGVTQQYEELEGKESKVVNAYEKIAANLKIDFTEGIRSIAEGTQIAGSVAKSAGIDFNTFAASIGTVAERTRQDGKSIANAYKTILARTSRSKVPGEDVSAEERGQAAKALANIGINVYDENGKYQSFGKTLDQLSEKWDKLTDSQRANVSEGLAGVRNLNILTSIVETWNDAKSLSKQVEEDPNYYLEVQEKSMDSLQSKMDTLKASMQNFWYNLLDVGAISEGIGLITKLSDAIGGLLSQIKLLPMVGNTLGISTVGGIGIVISQMIDNIIKERGKLKDEYGSAGLFGGFKTGFKSTFSDLNTLGLKKGAVLKDNQTTATITSLFAEGKQASGLASGIKNVWTNMTGLSKAVVGTVGAFAAFEAASKIFDQFTNTSKELKESVNSANAQFESQRKRITDNKNSLDSIKSEWSKLSEGVDLKTNENISLTSDEYERFIELNSEIASILPQTVAGMDNQGNAILNLSGSVSQLNNEYEKLLHQESEKRFLDNVKTYADEAKRLSGEAGFWDKSATILDGGDVSDIDGYEKTIDLLDKVSKINDVGVLKKYLYGDSDSGLQAQFSLPEVRYVEKTFGVSSTTSQEEWNEIIRTGQLKSALDEQKQILSSGANSVKNAMQDYLTSVSTVGGEYDKVNNKIINAASKLIGGLSDKTVIELGKSETQIRSTVTGFIDKLQKDPNLMSAFEKITSIDGSSSLNEIINSAGMVDVLESQLGLNGGSLNKLIGIDAKSIKKSYDKASKSVAKFNKVESKTGKILEDNKDLLDEFIDKNNINSEAELDKLKSLIDKSDTWQDVLNDWVLEGLDFDSIDTELESLEANLISVKDAFDKLNKAIQESNSSSGMSGESIDNLKSLFSGLKGYDADKLFENTYGGVRANPQELAKLTKEYKQTNYSKYTGEVADLEKKYAELSVQIDKSSSAVERNQALQERDKIKEKIKDAEMLQSQYEGLTNAVNMWQQAQSRGDEGDLYESVRSGFDEAKKLFDEGWIGDDRFQAFTQMFSKEDLSGAGSDIYEQVFANSLPKMERWFAEGTQGANNFLNDIAALNEGLVDAQGNVNWDKLPDMDTLADQLGVDVSLINTMFKALNRVGADLDFSEAADRLRGLRTEVENVGKGLDDATREKYTVDLDVENAEDIDAAIKQAEALKEEAKGNADATEYLSKQIDYLHAKAGEKTTMEVDIYSEEGIKNLNKDLDIINSKLDEDHKLKIEWDKLTPENIKSQIDSATNAVREFVNEDEKLDIETDGAQEALNILQALQQKAWDMNAESNILLRVDKSQVDSSTAQVIDDFAEIQAAAHNLESLKVTPGVEDSQLEEAKTKLQTLINEFNSSKGGMTATMDLKNLKIIDLASGKIDNLSSKLTSLNASSVLSALGVAENAIVGTQLPDKELTVKTKLIKGETETWKPSPKTQTVTAQLRKGDVNTWIPARRTQYVDVVKVSKGGNKVNGNANVNGNASLWQRGKAFAKGTWGAAKNSIALTGELGR